MAVLEGIKPEPVFRYFEEICAIPHGSGDTKRISDYCVNFAKEHGLRYIQDSLNNVILFQDGTPGYEEAPPVMLQGHLDMVCEKTPECQIDFEKEGLSLLVRDGMISADGTTLGGDDGIAIAYALAILAAEDIPHPPLEVVFTVDEETGMYGAAHLDCSPLKSKLVLNIDSEEEGTLLTGCAGGVNACCHLPVQYEETEGAAAVLQISGLTGGHSGVEIDKGRANACQLLGRVLYALGETISYGLYSVSGGQKGNAIPREAAAELIIKKEEISAVKTVVETYQKIFQAEYRVTDPELSVTLSEGGEGKSRTMDGRSRKYAVAALTGLPGGVQRRNADLKDLVQTSLNLGILGTTQEEVTFEFTIRSSLETEKEEVVKRLAALMDVLGGSVETSGDYPAWEYRRDSKLRSLMAEVFYEQYGRKPRIETIHAGLECGLFAGKIPELDCVSFGPDITDIHTTAECMDIASVQRTWEYLLEVLKRLK